MHFAFERCSDIMYLSLQLFIKQIAFEFQRSYTPYQWLCNVAMNALKDVDFSKRNSGKLSLTSHPILHHILHSKFHTITLADSFFMCVGKCGVFVTLGTFLTACPLYRNSNVKHKSKDNGN